MPCRGRGRGLSIEVLRRAMQDGTLEAALQRDTLVPPGQKRCKLCGEIKTVDTFRELPRGGHESYCRTCNKYVRRGIKRGLHIEAVRQTFMVRCFAFQRPHVPVLIYTLRPHICTDWGSLDNACRRVQIELSFMRLALKFHLWLCAAGDDRHGSEQRTGRDARAVQARAQTL